MTDLLCFDDLDAFATELDDPLAELEQDNYHRLITARGMNLDDPDLGLGLEEMLSAALDGSLGPRVEAELLKDERNLDVRARVTELARDAEGVSIQLDLEIETSDGVLAQSLRFNPDGVERIS